jgi:uroporphyrinogen decarboxylase
MNSRERVLTALNHEEPDRVPIDLWFTSEIEALLAPLHGGLTGPDLRVALGHDLVMTGSPNIGASYERAGSGDEYVCEWGVRWKWVTNAQGGRYTEAVAHPLAAEANLVSYQMPDPVGPTYQPIYRQARDYVERYGTTHAVFGSLYQTIFETAWLLRGMENLLQDMLIHRDFAHALFERLTDYALIAGVEMVAQGVDVLWLGDDFGTQHTMLIAPRLWREYFKERYARLIAAFKARNPALKVAYHSDGNIEPIIPDLIEIGLDVLNPVQPLSMNPAEIKRRFGDRLSFWGTVDVQRVFPLGSPHDVEVEVRRRMQTIAPGGGFILCSAHRVQAGTPLDNILAYYRAAREYGGYPIRAQYLTPLPPLHCVERG